MEEVSYGGQIKKVRSRGSVEGIGLAWIDGRISCAGIAFSLWTSLSLTWMKNEMEAQEEYEERKNTIGFGASHFLIPVVASLVTDLPPYIYVYMALM